MANYDILKESIAAVIKENGNQEITGNLLQQTLFAMVNTLGGGYEFAGVADQAVIPGTPDTKLFYIAAGPGIYTNFNNLVVNAGELAIFFIPENSSSWYKQSVPIPKVIDNLTSGGTSDALSAEQGKVLKGEFDELDRNKVSKSIGKNLFDKNHLGGTGGYIASNGTVAENSSYCYSDYIAVLPETNYYLSLTADAPVSSSGAKIAFYKEDLTFISYVDGNTKAITTPSLTAYMRFSITNTNLNQEIQLELGAARTTYNAYTDIYNKPINLLFPNTVGNDEIKDNSISTPKIQDGAVTENKIANGAVTFSKLNPDIVKSIDEKVKINSINIVDWDGADAPVNNYYYKASTGAIAAGTTDYDRIPLIPIKPNTAYYLSCIRNGAESGLGTGGSSDAGICFYSSNNLSSFISSIPAGTKSFTTPATARYIGISCYKLSNVTYPCLQEGTSRNYVPYNPITGYLNDDILAPKDNSISTAKIQDGAVTENKTIFFDPSKNLFDKSAITLGYYIGANGNIASNSSYAASDFIPVDPSQGYIISNKYGTSGAYNCFYDSDKTFITGGNFQSVPVAIPANAAYVRFSFFYNGNMSYFDDVQVEYGQETTAYVPYGYTLKQKYIPSESLQRQQLVLPKKLYLLSGVNFDIFYEPILRVWNPYRYDVGIVTNPTGRAYVKAIKRVCTLNTETAEPSSIQFNVYDNDVEASIISKSATILKGVAGVGNSQIKIGIIGDSYTDGGCFTPTLLNEEKVPNLKMVGTRSVDNSGNILQRLDGRSGWALSTFFNVQIGADYFNPFYHPQGAHRYWGNTAFWANVCGGSPTGYGTRYTHYASLCDATGWPVTPLEGDVIYDSTNNVFKEYQSGSWVQVATSVAAVKEHYIWEFNYSKYLSMWSIETADIFCVYLGVNDFWANVEPTDDNLDLWGTRLNAIINSYHSVNASGKFVVLCPNTVTYPNVNHYKRLDVHRRMFKLRKYIIDNFDQRESELIYIVDTAHLIDSENSYTIQETNPFDGYPNGLGYTNKEIWAGDGQHPRVSYTTIGYSLAGFIQNIRN